jgi:hypothetical protein
LCSKIFFAPRIGLKFVIMISISLCNLIITTNTKIPDNNVDRTLFY